MSSAEPGMDQAPVSFPAFDTLVAAAGVDEMLAARQKSNTEDASQAGASHEFRANQATVLGSGNATGAHWRQTFGGGSMAVEMTAAKRKGGLAANIPGKKTRRPASPVVKAEQVDLGRGTRRRVRKPTSRAMEAAMERRRVKDLEAGEDVLGPGGFAEVIRQKKRVGEEMTQWEGEDVDVRAKRMAVPGTEGDEKMDEVGGELGEEDVDWRPQSRQRGGVMPKPRKQVDLSSLLTPVDDPQNSRHRRRGRPPGSGNRKPMEPQRIGPDGTKQFNLRSAKFTGVYRTPANRWRAQFCHRGQVVQLGMYDKEDSAARRWDMEALRLRGTNTQLNFPQLKHLYLQRLEEVEKQGASLDIELPEGMEESLLQGEAETQNNEDEDQAAFVMDGGMEPQGPEGSNQSGEGLAMTVRDPRRKTGDTSSQERTSLSPIPILGNEIMSVTGEEAAAAWTADPWAMLNEAIVAVGEGNSGTKVVPDAVLMQVKMLLEGVVKAAEKDIQASDMRLMHASEIVRYGENLRREAQMSMEKCIARKEAALKILDKFQTVLTPVTDDEEPQQIEEDKKPEDDQKTPEEN